MARYRLKAFAAGDTIIFNCPYCGLKQEITLTHVEANSGGDNTKARVVCKSPECKRQFGIPFHTITEESDD